MANSLRAKLSKLRHDGNITDAEYQALIKKFDGHDAEIRAKAIDEFAERLLEKAPKNYAGELELGGITCYLNANQVKKIAEKMKGGAV